MSAKVTVELTDEMVAILRRPELHCQGGLMFRVEWEHNSAEKEAANLLVNVGALYLFVGASQLCYNFTDRGREFIAQLDAQETAADEPDARVCEACRGTGNDDIEDASCMACMGTGYLPSLYAYQDAISRAQEAEKARLAVMRGTSNRVHDLRKVIAWLMEQLRLGKQCIDLDKFDGTGEWGLHPQAAPVVLPPETYQNQYKALAAAAGVELENLTGKLEAGDGA